MNKIILSLAALAALSTASFAAERTDIDPRDRDQTSGYTLQINEVAPLYVGSGIASKAGLTAFERTQLQSAENENGGN